MYWSGRTHGGNSRPQKWQDCIRPVICEIMSEDGTMAKLPELKEIADKFGIKIVSIADLITYRRRHEKLVKRGRGKIAHPLR